MTERRGHHRPRRAPWFLPLGALLALALLWLVGSPTADAARPNGAGLVVRHGDGRLVYVYVEFTEPAITGADLLARSGLATTIAPFGGLGEAVCALDGEGCPADNCFCQSYQSPAYFWHYYTLGPDGTWRLAPSGPASRTIRDGDVDGWSWSAGTGDLPPTSIDEIARLNGVDRAAPEPPAPAPPPPPTPTPAAAPAPTAPPPVSANPPTVTPTSTPTPAQPAGPSPTVAATPAPAAVRATATPAATPTATVPPAASPAASPIARAVEVTPSGQITPRATDQGSGGIPASYLTFGALLLAAGGATAVALVRRRRTGGGP
ncbi:MAG: hypothetical protein QJR03_05225 [Sphaerobacter sp.]|nr:hypothetical protein [Sphaerobacter sp.]